MEIDTVNCLIDVFENAYGISNCLKNTMEIIYNWIADNANYSYGGKRTPKSSH